MRAAIVEKFGTQIEAANLLGIREARLSYILRGHVLPSEPERKVLEDNLGRELVRRLYAVSL